MNWLARRRIAISLIGFTSLVLVNVFVVGNSPRNPLAISQPLVLGSLLLILVGLVIRTWSAGTLNKSRELTTVGPYALVRNPLYVVSFLMMFGFCVLCRDLPTFIFVALPMSLLYWVQVRFEEVRLLGLFPEQWPDYASSVPRFFPKLYSRRALRGWTVYEWLRNREYQAVLASCLGLLGVYVWYVVAS
ncbi:MAG: methyltransferase [Pirellulaceae bacterium]